MQKGPRLNQSYMSKTPNQRIIAAETKTPLFKYVRKILKP